MGWYVDKVEQVGRGSGGLRLVEAVTRWGERKGTMGG